MTTKRTLIGFFLKTLLAGLLVAGALEIRLRTLSPSPFIRKGAKIVLPANKEYVFVNTTAKRMDPVIRVKRNSLGFRGAEPPAEWDRTLTIIVMGGSTAACDNLTEGKTWVDALTRKFEAAGSDVWINNAGFAGHSSAANILLLEDYVVGLRPKVVVFFTGINDVDADVVNKFDQDIVRGKFQFGSLIDFLRSVNRNVEILNVAVNVAQQRLGRKRAFSYNELDIQAAPRLTLTAEQKEAAIKAQKETNVKLFGERLAVLVETCRSNGIMPIFITVPSLFGAGTDDATGVDISQIRVSDGRNADLMDAILDLYTGEVKKLEEQGVAVIDLDRDLPKKTRYFGDFYHFTNEGAEEAGALIYPKLRKILEQFSRRSGSSHPSAAYEASAQSQDSRPTAAPLPATKAGRGRDESPGF